MATPAQIRDAVDARLAALWPTLVNRQNAYFALKGRYFQGVRTHSSDPVDGAVAAADRMDGKPSYQAEDWTAFGVGSFTESFSLEVHQYVGPLGAGWLAIARVTLGGRTFRRAKGQGPEDRDSVWTEVTSAP